MATEDVRALFNGRGNSFGLGDESNLGLVSSLNYQDPRKGADRWPGSIVSVMSSICEINLLTLYNLNSHQSLVVLKAIIRNVTLIQSSTTASGKRQLGIAHLYQLIYTPTAGHVYHRTGISRSISHS